MPRTFSEIFVSAPCLARERFLLSLPQRDIEDKNLMGSGFTQRIIFHIRRFLGMNVFLCDTCKWDWRSACHHPERPNATRCPDYEKRG
ncbi:hypothetical protein M1N46_01840 [Dehalococcoidia bacterium]|nr:hypothetical protein [Dehalococcoidia bacterium]